MKFFKGQAALEFMMTYGWAILVVLAAIGALSYFGILNPSRFTPDTCISSSGFACPGKPIVNESALTFSIVNGLGYKVNLSNDQVTFSSTLTDSGCTPGNTFVCAQGDITCEVSSRIVEDGSGVTIRVIGCNFADLNVIKGEVKISYRNEQSRLPETLIIAITGKSKVS